MIRKVRILTLAGFILLALIRAAAASPFIEINSVDAASDYPSIKVLFTLKNLPKGQSGDLTDEHISLFEDGYRVNHTKLLSMSDQKDFLYMVFSLDSTRRCGRDMLTRFKESAKEIITRANPNDKIAIYRFNEEILMLNNFTNSKSELMRSIDRIRTSGSKALLYNAIYDSIDFISRDSGSRRAVIIFTDGRDDGSSVSADDVISLAKDSGIPLHFICPPAKKGLKTLSRIARMTGGRIVSGGDCPDITSLYSAISGSVKNRYLLQYRSIVNADGKNHTIELRLKHGTLRDRETAEFLVPRTAGIFQVPSLSVLLFALMIILLLALLAAAAALLLKYRRKISGHDSEDEKQQYAFTMNLSDVEERDEQRKNRVLTPADPEYSYTRAWLVEKDGPESGKKFPIFWDQITLGRDDQNSIVIRDQAVSPQHAKIKKIDNAYLIFDLASDNGTFLNGKKLLRPKPLYDWDEIRIGRTLFIFRGSKLS